MTGYYIGINSMDSTTRKEAGYKSMGVIELHNIPVQLC